MLSKSHTYRRLSDLVLVATNNRQQFSWFSYSFIINNLSTSNLRKCSHQAMQACYSVLHHPSLLLFRTKNNLVCVLFSSKFAYMLSGERERKTGRETPTKLDYFHLGVRLRVVLKCTLCFWYAKLRPGDGNYRQLFEVSYETCTLPHFFMHMHTLVLILCCVPA